MKTIKTIKTMKMMKQWGVLLLVLLLTLSLAACGGEKEPDEGGEKSSVFTVVYNGTRLELGKSAESALSALGEPARTADVKDCGDSGKQVLYEYASVRLYLLESGDSKIIDKIELRDDMAETGAGITVGSTEQAVRDAYGSPSENTGSWLKYRSNNRELGLELSDGKVINLYMMQE